MVANFFEERIETVELKNGGQAFIQRPKAKPEGAVQSAADLPDDFDVNTVTANSSQLYRISVWPFDVSPLLSVAELSTYLFTDCHQLRPL